jgi:serine/threonine protein kinase
MGSVYRATDENLGVCVAVKENLFLSDEYARQFRLEANILAGLRHPSLPRVGDHFVIDRQGQYLVMDYIEGEDLRQLLDRSGTPPENEVIRIGAAVCDALTYLHTRVPPIVHRDIKPGNIKLTPDGNIVLVDFGLAKIMLGNQSTTTGARAMTPGYSPPEQYGTAHTDPRSDIYSLGATLYVAMTNTIPEDALARVTGNAVLTNPRKLVLTLSRKLSTAILKAMAVEPDSRFQTAEDFRQALLEAQSQPGNFVSRPTSNPGVGNFDEVSHRSEQSRSKAGGPMARLGDFMVMHWRVVTAGLLLLAIVILMVVYGLGHGGASALYGVGAQPTRMPTSASSVIKSSPSVRSLPKSTPTRVIPQVTAITSGWGVCHTDNGPFTHTGTHRGYFRADCFCIGTQWPAPTVVYEFGWVRCPPDHNHQRWDLPARLGARW